MSLPVIGFTRAPFPVSVPNSLRGKITHCSVDQFTTKKEGTGYLWITEKTDGVFLMLVADSTTQFGKIDNVNTQKQFTAKLCDGTEHSSILFGQNGVGIKEIMICPEFIAFAKGPSYKQIGVVALIALVALAGLAYATGTFPFNAQKV